jgi:hypothetical protein
MGQGGDISFKFNNLENEAVKQKLKEEINKESKKINVKHSTIKDLLFQTQPSRFIPRKIEQNDAGVD